MSFSSLQSSLKKFYSIQGAVLRIRNVIPDLGSEFFHAESGIRILIPDPGSAGQKSNGSRFRNTGTRAILSREIFMYKRYHCVFDLQGHGL
jgi:hypothetical protein